jgi:hypothetical protein
MVIIYYMDLKLRNIIFCSHYVFVFCIILRINIDYFPKYN